MKHEVLRMSKLRMQYMSLMLVLLPSWDSAHRNVPWHGMSALIEIDQVGRIRQPGRRM